MKKIITLLAIVASLFGSAQSPLPGYLTWRLETADSSLDAYYVFATTHPVAIKIKDSTNISFRQNNIQFDSLNKRRINGIPSNLAWLSDDGHLLRSPASSFTLTNSQVVNGLGFNPYPNSNPSGYISAYSTTLGVSGQSLYAVGGNTIILPSGTPTITAGQGISISKSGNSYTVSQTNRNEYYSVATNTAGIATFTFAAFSTTPAIQWSQGFGYTNKETCIPAAAYTPTSCSFYVQLRTDIIGILPTYSNVSGRVINISVSGN